MVDNALKQCLAVTAALICFSAFFSAPSAQGTRQMVQVAKDVLLFLIGELEHD